jgi:hypothetical protein
MKHFSYIACRRNRATVAAASCGPKEEIPGITISTEERNMLRRIILIIALLLPAVAAAQESDTTYTFITISDPHATSGTGAIRINDVGDIVGVYGTTTELGFLDVNGTFTTILPPGAGRAKALGINSSGEIVGYYRNCASTCTSSYPDIAFIYSKGKYTAVKSPSSAYPSIQFIGVNDSGTIVGSLLENPSADCTTSSSVCRGGFIYQGGKFSYLVAFGSPYTVATDISNSGEVIGVYYNTILQPKRRKGSAMLMVSIPLSALLEPKTPMSTESALLQGRWSEFLLTVAEIRRHLLTIRVSSQPLRSLVVKRTARTCSA